MPFLVTAATLAMAAVVLPFYGAFMWAAILALIFDPVQRRLLRRLGGHRNLVATLTLLGVLLMVVLPLAAITVSIAREVSQLAQSIQTGELDVLGMVQSGFDGLPAPLADLLSHFGIGDVQDLKARIEASAARVAQFVAGRALTLGQGTLEWGVELTVTVYLSFFMLRDGHLMSNQLWSALPLAEADKRQLRSRVTTAVRATIKGNFIVALVQGALGSIALAVLGVPGALLGGALMAVLSLLPAVGAALVWGPIAIYLAATGAVWSGLGLLAFGTLVIGLVDNLLRPILVGRDTQLPDWLVLLTTLGGIALLGLNGFVVGPVVASVFIAVWAIYRRHRGCKG